MNSDKPSAREVEEHQDMLDRKKREEGRQAKAMEPLFEELTGELYLNVGRGQLVSAVDLLAVLDRLVDDGYLKNGESVHSGLRRINRKFLETKQIPKAE